MRRDKEGTILRAAYRARLVFVQDGWEWGSDDSAYVPIIEEIEETISRLIDNLEGDPDATSAGAGRLHVERDVDDDSSSSGQISIYLEIGSLF